MLFLALKNLRARLGRTIFTALAIALGVAMIFAMRIVGNTLDATARAAREGRLAGADLEITSAAKAQVPLELLARLKSLPEVEKAAPIYRALEGRINVDGGVALVFTLEGTGLAILGVDPENTLTPYTLSSGNFLTNSQSVLLPASWAVVNGLRVGQPIELTLGDETRTYTIVGLLENDGLGGPPTAWLTIEAVNAAFNSSKTATAFLVRLKTGYTAEAAQVSLQTALGDQYFVTSASGGGSLNSLYNIIGLALPVAGFGILLAGSFLVFNAFAITLAERRREIGQLRALGMTRGQVLTQTLLEAGLLGLLGSTLGVLMGWALGSGVVAVIQTLNGDGAVPEVPIPWDAFPLAFGAGVLVTVAVTLTLALQAARISPLTALKESSATQPKTSFSHLTFYVSLLCFAAAVALYFNALEFARTSTTPSYGPLFLPVFVFGAGAIMLLPAWLDGALWLWRKIFAGGLLSQLAAANLVRARQRAALTAATLVISFMLVTLLTGLALFMSSFLMGINSSMFGSRPAIGRPMPPGTSLAESSALPSQPPLPADLRTDIESLSAVAEVMYFANASLPGIGVESGFGDQYAFAIDVRMTRNNQFFPLDEGTWEGAQKGFAENPRSIWLPTLTAKKFNKHVGDVIEINTLNGKLPFTVVAIGGGFPIISPQSAAEDFGSHPFFAFFEVKPGVDPDAFDAQLKALVERYPTEIGVFDTSQLQGIVDDLVGPLQAMFSGLASLSGLVAALGIVVTLFAAVLERQREIGTLRALGLKRAQVRNIVVLEAGFIGLVGATLGAAGGLGMTALFAYAGNATTQQMMGVTMVENVQLPWALALASIVIGPAVAVLAALWPADRAANVNPAEAMRAEGATGFLKAAQHLGPTGLRGFLARLPLAAKLSLASGLILVVALAVQTAVRVNAERQLIEDNLLALLARSSDSSIDIFREQLPAEVTELTPATLAAVQQETGAQQAEALEAQFRRWSNSQTEGDFKLLYFFMTDLDRTVIYSNEAARLGRVLTDTVTPNGSTTAVRLTSWFGERVFEGTMPIENQAGVKLGYFQAGLSAAPIDNFIRDVITSSLWTMALTLLAAIALTVWFTQRALTPVAQIAQASKAVARGDLSQRVPETNWDEVGSLARSFNEMVQGLNEREHLRDLFGRYLSREVSEAVLSGKVTLTGERKTITCLYVDMRGSTAFAEKHAPEDVMAALNQYFEVIILATEAHGGIVNRFVGDEAVCLFGAPTEYKDHADRALQAALAMREGLAYLNQKRATLGLPTLKFGMGLNTGAVVAGATGSEERQEYTVIGDAMNAGARIQALNKQFPDHDILLSEFTANAAKHTYPLIDLGRVELRGKSEMVRVFGLEPISKPIA